MGETKKRRQTKHRGNAAGMVESRGRTGVRGDQPARGVDSRGVRIPPEPSWQRAMLKALIPALVLIPFVILTQKDLAIAGKVFLILLAFVMYVPMSYYIDRWAYSRYLKQRGG